MTSVGLTLTFGRAKSEIITGELSSTPPKNEKGGAPGKVSRSAAQEVKAEYPYTTVTTQHRHDSLNIDN